MKNLIDITAFFREKLGFGLKDEDSTKDNKKHHKNNTSPTKTQTSFKGDAVVFAYSSKKDDFSYPVHTFINNNYNQQAASMNINNRLAPLPESCSASVIGIEEEHDRAVDLVVDRNFADSDSFNSDEILEFNAQAWKRVMAPLDILEFLFSKSNRTRHHNYSTVTVDEVPSKLYVTKIPTELLSSAVMNYCSRQLTKMVPSAFSELKSLTSLQLCCNSLTELPPEVCLLRRLETLSLSNNKLKMIPSTIGYLMNLENLYLDRNQLTTLPRSISGLTKLKVLSLAANEFVEIPRSVMLLNRLVTLECDRNPNLRGIPSEITRFSQLARFHVEDCPKLLKEAQYSQYSATQTAKGGPSLLECSARSLIRNRRPILYSVPRHLKLFISRAEECSFCSGPLIDARSTHCRTIKRIDRFFPVIDQLCCAHWPCEEERKKVIFSAAPTTTPPLLLNTDRRSRAGQLAPFNQFDPERCARGQRILKKFKSEEIAKVMVPLALIVDWPEYPC